MTVFLISANVILWIWQIRQFRSVRGKIRDKWFVYGLYAIALGLNLMSAENWIVPDLLRPLINGLQQVNRIIGAD